MEEFISEYGQLMIEGTIDTLSMSLISTVFAYIIGLPLGIALYVTKEGGIMASPRFYKIVGWIVNILRSLPFLILMVAIKDFTRFVAGTMIGPTAAIVPLTIGIAPFIARLVESALSEIDYGVIEACKCMGASNFQIIKKVLLSESLPSIIRGIPITIITLIGYSAVAGALGSGGLGDIAYRYGLHRSIESVMYASIIILVIIVCFIQVSFDKIATKTDKRTIG